MGHCGGNAATDQIDMLTPMVNWIENGVAPDSIVASGRNFSSTLGTLTGLPTTRSRPLCAYPKTLRYVGPTGGDISIASNSDRLAVISASQATTLANNRP
jgi:feruloyl esterase